MRTRELIDAGMDPAAARQVAQRRLGDFSSVRRTCLEEGRRRDQSMHITQWLDELRDDVKFGVRQMAGAPAFTLVAVVTLALGIGANSAIFALADATLLRPLPLPDPGRLVRIWERTDGSPHTGVSPLNLADWNERSHTIRAGGRLHARRRRHGNGRRGRDGRNRASAVGPQSGCVRRARHQGRGRPDVYRRRPADARPCRGAERGLLARALRGRSLRSSGAMSGSMANRSPSSASSRRKHRSSGAPASGR